MAGEVTLQGTVVDREIQGPFDVKPDPEGGLFLLADDGRHYALVADPMYTQMGVDQLHRNSRRYFEGHLNERVTVTGYRSGSTLYEAAIAGEAAAGG